MKFDEKYPNAIEGTLASSWRQGGQDFPNSMWFTKYEGECWHCKALTTWIDMDFQAFICSEECQEAKWKEYCEACRLSNEKAAMSEKRNNIDQILLTRLSHEL